jgi:hypothetical protein
MKNLAPLIAAMLIASAFAMVTIANDSDAFAQCEKTQSTATCHALLQQ